MFAHLNKRNIVLLCLFTSLSAQAAINVSSLAELREAVQKNGQKIMMKPGSYVSTDLPDGSINFPCSGSNNTIDLTDVHIKFPIGTSNGPHFTFSGSGNTLTGGFFEDVYQNGMTEVTDFGSYNQNRKTLAKGLKGGANIVVSGDDNTIAGIKLTARGSFPYGYGSIYGIGRGNAAGLDKRCALLITGVGNTVDGCEFQHRAFGHVIYMQNGADETLIKNTYIEGAVRPSNDLYKETNDGDLPKRFDFKMPVGDVAGLPIPRDVMLNLTEDGIRAYPIDGSVTVENCIVKKTRGGIKLYLAKGAVTVTDCTVLDCVVQGYSLPNGGKIINSIGNAAYGPLIYMHSDRSSNHQIELKVLAAPHAVGNHVFAAIKGTNHEIKLTQEGGSPVDTTLRPIVVGYKARFQFLTTYYPELPPGYEENYKQHFDNDEYTASGIEIENGTEYPVILGEFSNGNKISSEGNVSDLGKHNRVSQLKKSRESKPEPIRVESADVPQFSMPILPGTIELENYDPVSGEGRTFYDTTKGNRSGAYRTDDVDIVALPNGGFALSQMEKGEWLTYTVSVSEAGIYDVAVRYAAREEGAIQIGFKDGASTDRIILPTTEGTSWATHVLGRNIPLNQGGQQMKVMVTEGKAAYILDHISIQPSAVDIPLASTKIEPPVVVEEPKGGPPKEPEPPSVLHAPADVPPLLPQSKPFWNSDRRWIVWVVVAGVGLSLFMLMKPRKQK